MTDQWYLFESQDVPPNFLIFDDTRVEGRGRIIGCVQHELTALGAQLFNVELCVRENTKFAGVLWGDGNTYDLSANAPLGVLGELDLISRSAPCIRFADGSTLSLPTGDGDRERHTKVVPPELFGLKRQDWWEDKFLWKTASP